jgi:hypothetical protein
VTERRLIELWIGLRIFTLLWASGFSLIRPLTDREKTIPIWPPTSPYVGWFERAIAAPWERWDAHYYANIVERGYRPDDGTAQFHPLLPMLAKPFFWAPMIGLLLVSSLASLWFVRIFYRLAELDIPNPETATRLLVAFPLAFVLFAPYTEGLWLLFAAWSFLHARKGRWWYAGATAALATLARQQGLFLIAPLAYELWVQKVRDWRRWAALALIPAALLGWIAYRGIFLSDVHPDLSSVNSLLYTTVLAPSATKVVHEQAMLLPWDALWQGLAITTARPTRENVMNMALAAVFILLTSVAWKRMRGSYRILTVILTAVAFAYYTGPFKPYMGLPRHLFLAFPIFIGAAPALERYKVPVAAVGTIGMLLLTIMFVLEAWVP